MVSSPTETVSPSAGICDFYSIFGSIWDLRNSKRCRDNNEHDYEANSGYCGCGYIEVKSSKSQLFRDTQIQHLMYCQSI